MICGWGDEIGSQEMSRLETPSSPNGEFDLDEALEFCELGGVMRLGREGFDT